MKEMLNGMKSVKFYCWQQYFDRIILNIRRLESIRYIILNSEILEFYLTDIILMTYIYLIRALFEICKYWFIIVKYETTLLYRITKYLLRTFQIWNRIHIEKYLPQVRMYIRTQLLGVQVVHRDHSVLLNILVRPSPAEHSGSIRAPGIV